MYPSTEGTSSTSSGSSSSSSLSMVSIAYCPVCTGSFRGSKRGQPSELRPYSIPCGHVFCSDCLTRLCYGGRDNGFCPYCRAPFRLSDLRWLFLNDDYDFPSDAVLHSRVSDESKGLERNLDRLHTDRRELEQRILRLGVSGAYPDEALESLQNRIQLWLERYDATGQPDLPSRPLRLAAASLNIINKDHNEMLKDTRSQLDGVRRRLRTMQRDIKVLHQINKATAKRRHDVELKMLEKDVEIHALRDLNTIYRNAVGTEELCVHNAQPAKETTVPNSIQKSQRTSAPRRHSVELSVRPFNVHSSAMKSTEQEGQAPKKTVSWYRTSLRHRTALSNDGSQDFALLRFRTASLDHAS